MDGSADRKSPFVVIFITILIDMFGYGMVVPLLPYYVRDYAGGAVLVGSLGSMYALMQFLAGPLLGALSDRFGRRPVLLACLLGTSLAFLLLGLADSLPLVILAILLDGITGGNLSTAYAYIADETTPATRARGIGLVGAAFGLGMIGGPALGGILSSYGLSLPAFTASAVALANVSLGFFVLRESLPPERRAQHLELRTANVAGQLLALMRLAGVRLLLMAIFILNLAFSGLQNNFPLFSQARFGWDSLRTGIFFAFVGLVAVTVQGVIFPILQPRSGEKHLAVAGLALMCAGLGGTSLAHHAWQVYPLIALVALGSGLAIPSLTGLMSNRVESSAQGRLMGGMQALLSLAMIIGPSMAGLAFEHVSPGAPYALGSLLAGLALLVAFLALYRIPREAGVPVLEE